jgi:hypothetical protein
MAISKRLHQRREKMFPDLNKSGYEVTSPEDDYQNCIAYAAGKFKGVWTPYAGNGYYWPDGLPRNTDVNTFVKLYKLEAGYDPCDPSDKGEYEEGIEKVAIYVDSNNEVTHAAKQNIDGTWTSKLGDWEDIRHNTPEGVGGDAPAYGKVAKYLRRKRQ